ncbi:type VII secretion protein EssB/YukC, partial [Streptococcus dentapri]
MEELFYFLGQEFTLVKDPNIWQLTLKRSMVNLTYPEQLELLDAPSAQLLPQTYQVDEETVSLTYEVPSLGRSFGEVQALPMSEQLRFSLNILSLAEVTSYPFGLILHPANLFITKDLTLQLAYR